MLIDLTNKNIPGAVAETALSKAGITVNKNTVPFDQRSPFDPSGIRLGTPALTTRGMKEAQMVQVADWIDQALESYSNESALEAIHAQVKEFCQSFPLPIDI